MIARNWPGMIVPDTLFKITFFYSGCTFPLLQNFFLLGMVVMTTSSNVSWIFFFVGGLKTNFTPMFGRSFPSTPTLTVPYS